MAGFDSPASPASRKGPRTRLPGWQAILVREETFKRLQRIQASTVDPHLDLRYLGDAAVLITLDEGEGVAIVKRAVEEMKRRL